MDLQTKIDTYTAYRDMANKVRPQPVVEALALAIIKATPGIKPTTLANKLHVSQPMITQILHQLSQKGKIIITINNDNHREKCIYERV